MPCGRAIICLAFMYCVFDAKHREREQRAMCRLIFMRVMIRCANYSKDNKGDVDYPPSLAKPSRKGTKAEDSIDEFIRME